MSKHVRILVAGAVGVMLVQHHTDLTNRETEMQRGTDVGEKGSHPFDLEHNTSLRLEGNGSATFDTGGEKVEVVRGALVEEVSGEQVVELYGAPVTIRFKDEDVNDDKDDDDKVDA